MTAKQLVSKINEANYYYRIGQAIMPDSKYDELVDQLKEIDPDNDLLSHIGFRVADRKAKLPIDMASMNKIKTIEEIAEWFRLKMIPSKTQIIITPKYDGLSLCVNEKHQIAYTRGDGKIGQLSTLHYSMMKNKLEDSSTIEFTFGEAIMPKSTFVDSYSGEFANARNLLSGLFNSKEPSEYLEDCVYIKYGASGHDYKTKRELLDRLNLGQEFKVPYVVTTIQKVDNALIKSLFKEWSKEFEIDGLILEINDFESQEVLGRETSTNNPVWARALKHKDFESSTTSVVRNITWNISKQGLLKPTINIQPVLLDGVVISNVTGNNARYIKEMGIGIGSEVVVVRSGMVIPVITEVITTKPFEIPTEWDCEWNENGVELIVKAESKEQVLQKVVSFFEILEAKGISEGVLAQLLDHYRDSWTTFKEAISIILNMKESDMLSIYRFGKKKANSTFWTIQSCVKNVSLAKLQHATGVFNGLGSKKLELLTHFYAKPSVTEVMSIVGFAQKSAEVFVNNWDNFYEFIEGLPITIAKTNVEEGATVGDDLNGLSFCFTGVRSADLEDVIKSRGGKIASGVSKNLTHLISKTKGSGSSKEQKAIELGVKIMDIIELENFLNS